MDRDLKETALAGKSFNTQNFSDTKGDVKDIEGIEISYWQFKDN